MNQRTPGEPGSPASFEELAENPVSRRGWILGSIVLALVILGLGGWTALSTAETVHSTFSPVYFWDQWTIVSDLQRSNGVLPISRLWAQHNEHRILVGRLALFADLKFFGGNNTSLLIEIYLVQFSLVLLFTWMCYCFGNSRGAVLATIAGFCGFCMFSPLQIENFYWGFQITFVFAGLAAAVSFACMVWHASKTGGHDTAWISWPLILAFIAALLSEYSIADGLVVWPVLLWLGFALRLAKRTQLLVLVVALAAIGLYFVGYRSPAEHSDPWLTIRRPLSLAKFVVTYLGSTWDSFPAHWDPKLRIPRGQVVAAASIVSPKY